MDPVLTPATSPRLARSKTLVGIAAALSAAFLLLRPSVVDAQELPVLRAEVDVGGIGLLDRGALNRELQLGRFEPLPSMGIRAGGGFGFEWRRWYFGFGIHAVDVGNSETRKLRSTYATVDLGYRLFGRHTSWEFIPVVGIGGGVSYLTLGPATDAYTFQQAIHARGPQELNAASLIVHVGFKFDVLRLYNVRIQKGLAVGFTGGLQAAPLTSSWSTSDSTGRAAATRGLDRSPHVPGTGPYLGVTTTISF
jgi:hypothetical protein